MKQASRPWVTPGIEKSLVIEKIHQKTLNPHKSKTQNATDLSVHALHSVSIVREEIRIKKLSKEGGIDQS